MKQRDLLIGIGLILLGVLFLLGPALDFARFGWPFFVIIPGAALLFVAFTTPASNSALAVPGSILATIGLVLLVFSINDHWQGWAYAWALIVAASGVGNYLHGMLSDNPKLRSAGMRTATYGVVAFVLLGLFFELLIFGSRGGIIRWLVPVALIVAGVVVLYLNNRRRPAMVSNQQIPPAPPAAGPATPPPTNQGNGKERG